MKKVLILILAVINLSAYGQIKISQMPTYNGNTANVFFPIQIGAGNYKYPLDSLPNKSKLKSDSSVLAIAINAKASTATMLDSIGALKTQIATKQNTLIAGSNITIVGNTISASGGGGGTFPNIDIFGNNFGNAWGKADSSKIRIFTAALRVICNPDNTITWNLLNDPDHYPIGFTGVSAPNNSVLRITYPTMKRIFYYSVNDDEQTALKGITSGATIGLNFADMTFGAQFPTRQFASYNGTSWSLSGNNLSISSISTSGTQIKINRLNNLGANSNSSYSYFQVFYSGTNNRSVRYVSAGIGYNETIVELVNNATGTAVAPDANDKIIIFNSIENIQLGTQSVSNSHNLERYFFGENGTANFTILLVGELQ